MTFPVVLLLATAGLLYEYFGERRRRKAAELELTRIKQQSSLPEAASPHPFRALTALGASSVLGTVEGEVERVETEETVDGVTCTSIVRSKDHHGYRFPGKLAVKQRVLINFTVDDRVGE